MRRRGIGVGAVLKEKDVQAKFREKGEQLASEQLTQLSTQLDQFRDHLERFARDHKNEIRKNPTFRKQFQDMCAAIGVDPLASAKGYWAEKLGVGDFYYELSVQVVEVCMATAPQNGGMMTLDELKTRLVRSRNKSSKDDITTDDILKAIEKLRCLGNGLTLIPLGKAGEFLVQSVPGELNRDFTRAFQVAQERCFVTATKLSAVCNWDITRAEKVLDYMVQEGFAWVDDQASDGERQFWFPSLFSQNRI